jgi:hypothetical protein
LRARRSSTRSAPGTSTSELQRSHSTNFDRERGRTDRLAHGGGTTGITAATRVIRITNGRRSGGSATRIRDVRRSDTPGKVLRRGEAAKLTKLVVEVCLIPIADGLRHIRPIGIFQ